MYPFVEAVYWWFLIVYILFVRTRVPYYIGIKWYNIITCILFSLHLHFKFTFTFTFLHQKSPVTFVTFVIASQSFYFFTFLLLNALLPLNCVPTQPLLRRDVSGAASGRSHRYVVTQFQMHREEVKNIRMQAAIPRDALSDSSNIFLSYTGLLIFCPCVRQQYKM